MNPASEVGHALEGVCTCPTTAVAYQVRLGTAPVWRNEISGWSRSCGLSTHRVLAARAITTPPRRKQ